MPADADSSLSRPLHEAQLMELAARYEAYALTRKPATFPFEAGDLVTPRQGSNQANPGQPFIVLEVRPQAAANGHADDTPPVSPYFGQRLNIRILGLTPDAQCYLAWWVEAFQYERYPPAATG